MLVIENQEHYQKVIDFAVKTNRIQNLKERLNYLGTYACHNTTSDTKCTIYKDFAPYSFCFVMERKVGDHYERWFSGGLIFNGEHDGKDGNGPSLSVSLSPVDGWSINT